MFSSTTKSAWEICLHPHLFSHSFPPSFSATTLPVVVTEVPVEHASNQAADRSAQNYQGCSTAEKQAALGMEELDF